MEIYIKALLLNQTSWIPYNHLVIFARFLEIFVLNLNYSWKIC